LRHGHRLQQIADRPQLGEQGGGVGAGRGGWPIHAFQGDHIFVGVACLVELFAQLIDRPEATRLLLANRQLVGIDPDLEQV